MSLEQLIILSIIQGITEFLPISSSGHLIFIPGLLGWEDQGILIDVAVHVGSLFAVVIYFWRDLVSLLGGALDLIRGQVSSEGRLVLLLAGATVPIVVAGLVAHQMGLVDYLRSVEVIGWTTLIFGLVLYAADRADVTVHSVRDMTVRQALIVGGAQVLSLIPGTSRSGITMTAARFLGFQRSEAARFSMLLSIPTISSAGLLAVLELSQSGDAQLTQDAVIAGALSFGSAFLAIWGLMSLVNRIGFLPFVIYRTVLGLGLLIWVYF